MAKVEELKKQAAKLREAVKLATKKLKEAVKAKSADVPKLKEALKLAEGKAAKADKAVDVAQAEAETETENETETEETEEAEDGEGKGSDDGDGDGDGDGDDGHDDADQDKALIKKMIADHLGDDAKGMSKEEMEAMHGLAKEAYEAHKEMGCKEDEAYQHAGHALKLAHHMQKKQAAAAESEPGDPDGDGDGDTGSTPPPKKGKGKSAPDDDGDGDDSESENENENETRESNRTMSKKLLEAEGRIAALESKLKKGELDRYIEAQLKASGLPKPVTKRFIEKAGKIKSKQDFDEKFAVYKEGASNFSEEIDWGLLAEKSTAEDGHESGSSGKSLNFSECAE